MASFTEMTDNELTSCDDKKLSEMYTITINEMGDHVATVSTLELLRQKLLDLLKTRSANTVDPDDIVDPDDTADYTVVSKTKTKKTSKKETKLRKMRKMRKMRMKNLRKMKMNLKKKLK